MKGDFLNLFGVSFFKIIIIIIIMSMHANKNNKYMNMIMSNMRKNQLA